MRRSTGVTGTTELRGADDTPRTRDRFCPRTSFLEHSSSLSLYLSQPQVPSRVTASHSSARHPPATRIMIGAQGCTRATRLLRKWNSRWSPHYSLTLSRLSPALSSDFVGQRWNAVAPTTPSLGGALERDSEYASSSSSSPSSASSSSSSLSSCTVPPHHAALSESSLTSFLSPSLSLLSSPSLSCSLSLFLVQLRYSEAQRLGARFELSRLWGADHYLDEPPGSLDKTWWGRSGRRANSPPPHHSPHHVVRIVGRQSRCLHRIPFVPIYDPTTPTPSSPRLRRLHRSPSLLPPPPPP